MKNLLKITLLITIIFATGANQLNAQNYELMLGKFNLDELKASKNADWFNKGFESYTPNQKIINQISDLANLDEVEISIYLGTWCPDSRRELPRLVKILNLTNFDIDKLQMVGVTRTKKVPYVSEAEAKSLNILNVPTIIVYKNGKELNRFVEFAVETLEEDLYKIIAEKAYKHSYDF